MRANHITSKVVSLDFQLRLPIVEGVGFFETKGSIKMSYNGEVKLLEEIFQVLYVNLAAHPTKEVIENQDTTSNPFTHGVAVDEVNWLRTSQGFILHLEC